MKVKNIGQKYFGPPSDDTFEALVTIDHENGNVEEIRLTELIERIAKAVKEEQCTS